MRRHLLIVGRLLQAETLSVIPDSQNDIGIAHGEPDLGSSGLRVLGDIGETFLNNAITGQLDLRVQPSIEAHRLEFRLQPKAATGKF